MVFPRDYSAFGLAKEQRPARWFMTISVLLRVGGCLSYLPLFWAAHGLGFTPAASAQNTDEQGRTAQLQDGDMSRTLAAAFNIGMIILSLSACCGCCFLSQCFCVENDFSGAATADLALQQRIEDRARVLSAQMRSAEFKPTWKEYVMLHVNMVLFVWDFVSDGLAAWTFFQQELYGFFTVQMVIIVATLWEESRVVRRLGVRAVYHAVAESSSRGWASDTLLSIILQEKIIEAVPSSMLFGFASLYSQPAERRQLLGYDITLAYTIFTMFKIATSTYGSVNAAYVLMHLDLDRHIADAVERVGLPKAPRTGHQGMPSHRPPPAELVGPAVRAEIPGVPPGSAPTPAPAAFPGIAPTPAPVTFPGIERHAATPPQGNGWAHLPAQEGAVNPKPVGPAPGIAQRHPATPPQGNGWEHLPARERAVNPKQVGPVPGIAPRHPATPPQGNGWEHLPAQERAVNPKQVGPVPGIAPRHPATPPQGNGWEHLPAQERAVNPKQVGLVAFPQIPVALQRQASPRLSMPPLPPIQVGASRGAVDKE